MFPTPQSISVIIPTYNRAHTLLRAIDSVLAQTHQPHEILIVDDGSTDNTQQALKQYADRIQVILQTNHGVSHARNRGVNAATGNWVAFLDSDDEWLPDKLALQIDTLQQNPQSPLCHGEEQWIRNGVRVNAKHKHRKYGGWIFNRCLPLCVISPSCALIYRQFLLDIGGFDTSLPACEDYDLWLRICAQHPAAFVETPIIIKHGGHADQLSTQHWGMDRFRVQSLTKLLDSNVLNEEQLSATRTILQKKCRVLIKGSEKRNNQAMINQCTATIDRYC